MKYCRNQRHPLRVERQSLHRRPVPRSPDDPAHQGRHDLRQFTGPDGSQPADGRHEGIRLWPRARHVADRSLHGTEVCGRGISGMSDGRASTSATCRPTRIRQHRRRASSRRSPPRRSASIATRSRRRRAARGCRACAGPHTDARARAHRRKRIGRAGAHRARSPGPRRRGHHLPANVHGLRSADSSGCVPPSSRCRSIRGRLRVMSMRCSMPSRRERGSSMSAIPGIQPV